MVGAVRPSIGPVRLALALDAAAELAGAIVLAVAADRLADLFNLDVAIVWLAAAIFMLASVSIAAIMVADLESRELVWALAAGNIGAGALGWLAFALFRDEIDPGARWILTATADTFILVGLLEVLALRRAPSRD